MTGKLVYIIVFEVQPRARPRSRPNEVPSFVGDEVLRFGVIDHSEEFSSGRYEGR